MSAFEMQEFGASMFAVGLVAGVLALFAAQTLFEFVAFGLRWLVGRIVARREVAPDGR